MCVTYVQETSKANRESLRQHLEMVTYQLANVPVWIHFFGEHIIFQHSVTEGKIMRDMELGHVPLGMRQQQMN